MPAAAFTSCLLTPGSLSPEQMGSFLDPKGAYTIAFYSASSGLTYQAEATQVAATAPISSLLTPCYTLNLLPSPRVRRLMMGAVAAT